MAEHATIPHGYRLPKMIGARRKLLAATGEGWSRALGLLVGVTVPARLLERTNIRIYNKRAAII